MFQIINLILFQIQAELDFINDLDYMFKLSLFYYQTTSSLFMT